MGSFRIVTGSGYGRHEIKSTRAVADAFRKIRAELVQTELVKQTSSGSDTLHADSDRTARNMIGYVYANAQARIMRDLQKKADMWAKETVAEFKAAVPVDTGKLKNSIDILGFTVSKSSITATVGVDKNKISGPPYRMRRANGRMRTMPHYDYSPYVIGKDSPYSGTDYAVIDAVGRGRASSYAGNRITSRFSKIAKTNAQKIITKK